MSKASVSILGYGSQGRAMAKNLAESGYEVRIGLRADSQTKELVAADNLRSATLREVLVGLLNETQIDQLMKYREESPDCTLFEAMEDMEMRDKDKMMGKVMTLLTDMSLCHGLWVIARGKTRSWYSFHVRRHSDQRHWSFQW